MAIRAKKKSSQSPKQNKLKKKLHKSKVKVIKKGFSSNNFNHIRSLLWKSHKKDFKGYFDPEFIEKVNVVYNHCKGAGFECTDADILGRYKSIKKLKEGAGFSSNNFNYIRSLIWKTYKQDFKNYSDPEFIRKVNSIYYDCKALGVDCSDEIIFEKYNLIKADEKRPLPFIEPELFNPQVYYLIKDVAFNIFAPYLWIVSPMIIPKPSEFLAVNYFDKNGDSFKGYSSTFREWVDWCNTTLRNQYGSTYGSEVVEMYFRFIPPVYNEILRRWESEIVICTPSGQVYDFGYKPIGKKFEHDVKKEYIEADEEILKNKPTVEQESEQMDKLRIQKINSDLQNAFEKLRNKLKEKYRKVQEEELNIKLKHFEALKKELSILTKTSNEFKKLAKLAKSAGFKKEYAKYTKEVMKVGEKIIQLTKQLYA